jgi:hypothetical protein
MCCNQSALPGLLGANQLSSVLHENLRVIVYSVTGLTSFQRKKLLRNTSRVNQANQILLGSREDVDYSDRLLAIANREGLYRLALDKRLFEMV